MTGHQTGLQDLIIYAVTGDIKQAAKTRNKGLRTVKNNLSKLGKSLGSRSSLHTFAILVAAGIITQEMLQDAFDSRVGLGE